MKGEQTMWKSFAVCLTCAVIYATGAIAETCATDPYPLANGTTADADQVMGNFNNLLDCANNNLAPLVNPHFTGNVGIGTANPSYPLEVTGTTKITGNLAITAPSGVDQKLNLYRVDKTFGQYLNLYPIGTIGPANIIWAIGRLPNDENFSISNWNGSVTTKSLYIIDSGEVGIGTENPTEMLTVGGNIRIGTSGTNGCIQNFAGTALAGTCSSDARLKITSDSITNVLDGFSRLRLVHFKWNEAAATIYHNSTKPVNTGFTAQSVEKVFPELVSTDSHGYKQVNYTGLQLYGLEAVKELKAENDRQAEEIAALKQAVVALQRQIQTQTATNDKARPMIKRPK